MSQNLHEISNDSSFIQTAKSQSFSSGSRLLNPVVNYLTISPQAAKQIGVLIENRSEPCEGVRVAVRTRGCSGLSYVIEYALEQNITKFDDLVISKNELAEGSQPKEIKVFLDPKVSLFLIGSEMVYKTDELSSGFDFVNPNEKGRCGCGESFSV